LSAEHTQAMPERTAAISGVPPKNAASTASRLFSSSS
jgi:hypothetical protein